MSDEIQLSYPSNDQRMLIEVREAISDDKDSMVRINRSAFPHGNARDHHARLWIEKNWNSPYFVITSNKLNVIGYILWVVKGGYKDRIACELERTAIDENYRPKGFGSYLTKVSLIKFQDSLRLKFALPQLKIGVVHLTTGCNNHQAQLFYRKILQVEQKGGNIGAIYGVNEYGEEEIVMVNENLEPVIDRLMEENKSLAI